LAGKYERAYPVLLDCCCQITSARRLGEPFLPQRISLASMLAKTIHFRLISLRAGG
jgi:hypothetical protein